ASIPIVLKAPSARIPALGSRSRAKSSKPTRAASGPRTAMARRRKAASGQYWGHASSFAFPPSRRTGWPPKMPDPSAPQITLHASCVALKDDGILILGAPGTGKSDLALRLIDEPGYGAGDELIRGRLVADDQ